MLGHRDGVGWRALAKGPADRYTSTSEFAVALARSRFANIASRSPSV